MASNNDPFAQFTAGTELGVSDKVAKANTPPVDANDPFAAFPAPSAPEIAPTDTDNKDGFVDSFMGSRLFAGTKPMLDKMQKEGVTAKGVLDVGKQEASNAWNLLEGNTFANDARVFTGTSAYNMDVDTISSELNDTNARMAELAKQKQAGKPFDSRYYQELADRQAHYSNMLGQVADDATKKADTWNTLKTNISQTGKNLMDNPTGAAGQLAGGMLDSLFQDPELMALGGASTAIKRLDAASGIAAKTANLGINIANNKFARGSVYGAAMIAPIDMAQQLNEKNTINYGQTGTQLISGMLLGVLSKGIFNDSALSKANDVARNTVLKATGSGKTSLASVVKDLTGDEDTHAVAQAAGVVGGDYDVQTLIPEEIKIASKKANAEIEALSQEPVSTKGIEVSESEVPESIEGKEAVPQDAYDKLNNITIGKTAPSPSTEGIDVSTVRSSSQMPKQIVLGTSEPVARPRTNRPFKTDITGEEPAMMAIDGNKFQADIKDDDGFKMGTVRGFVNGNIVQPLINSVADRDAMMYPKSVYNTWEQLTKYALSSGKTFQTFLRADAGQVDFMNDMESKGYSVVRNPNWAYDWNTGDHVSLDHKPMYSIVGHQGAMGSPELVEARKSLTSSYDEYMAGTRMGRPNQYQEGKAKLGALVPMALFGAGFAYGYSKQQSILQGFKDAAIATSLTLVPSALALIKPVTSGIIEGIRGSGKEHYKLGAFGEDFNNTIQQGIPYKAYVLRNSINTILGPTEQHHNTFMALHGDEEAQAGLKPHEQEVYRATRKVNDAMGKIGQEHGIIDEAMNDFFSRWMRPGPNAPQIAKDNWGKYRPWQERKYAPGIDGLKQLMKDGYVPVTENIGDIMQNYVTSMSRAVELNKFTSAAKEHVFADGTRAVLPTDEAPKDYIPLVGTLHGFSGHPDVARDFNFLLDFPKFSAWGKAYDFVNYGMKRGQLNLALFHPGQLAKNYTFASVGSAITDVDPARLGGLMKGIANSVNPNSAIHQMIKGGDPVVQDALSHGMTLSLGRTPEDFSSDSFYGSLDKMSEYLDKQPMGVGQGAKTLVDAYSKLSHLNDKVAFEMIQNYFKMDTFMREVQKQTQVSWNNHLRQPDKFDEPDLVSIKKGVASYVNNLYGGENYYQIVQDSNNWFMKNVKSETFNPSMRRKLLQRTEYAPDWTLSVIRSVSQAIPGLSDNAMAGALHRRFVAGLAAMTFTAANIVNHHYSGKYIWQNDNPGYIDLGNGYRMQWDKQLSELVDMTSDFPKWTLNRMAALPRYGFELTTNQQYVSKHRAPPIVPKGDHGLDVAEDEGLHLAAQWLPISGHQAMETQSGRSEFNKQGLISAGSSMVSFPIYKNPSDGSSPTKTYDPKYISQLLKQYKPKIRKPK